MANNLMINASSALLSQTTSGDLLNNAEPAYRTGILQDTSKGKLKRDFGEASACEGMFQLDKAFKKIGDVMTSMQEWSGDSNVSAKKRYELILNLSLMELAHCKTLHEQDGGGKQTLKHGFGPT